MELLENYFAELIQCVDASYLVIGIILVFLSVPDTADYAPYRKAKYFLASAFFVMFINLYLWLEIFSSQDWEALNSIIACMDISLFFLTCICFAYSFASLLDSQYINKKRMLKDFGYWILTISISWISLWEPLAPYAYYLYIISTLIFCSMVVRYMFHFQFIYRKKREQLENYFSDDNMQRFMFWTKKSLFFLCLLGVFAYLTLFFGIYFNYAYQVYIVSVNLYIVISFINYRPYYGTLNLASVMNDEIENDSNQELETSKLENYENLFGARLQQWVDDKKYLSSQLTIDSLASEMGTNKVYLSRYINGKHAVNFSTWVTTLRIKEAQVYMLAHPGATLEEVAYHVGFSSASYFSRVFSRIVKTSPTIWRSNI